MTRLRILFTARDPGGLGNILPVFNYFRVQKNIEAILATSGVAFDCLYSQGIDSLVFVLPNQGDHIAHGEDPTQLLETADSLLARCQPDAIVTALSSFGAGIDEAVIARASVPTFAVQDCWGDVNTELGVTADTYFVIDDVAKQLSQSKYGVRAAVVGAPKYTAYLNLDILGMRQEYRSIAGATKKTKIICWFGQSPEIPGYEEVLNDFIAALPGLDSDLKVVFRGHPKFLQDINPILKTAYLDTYDATNKGIAEGWLAACDLVVTPFSMSGVDHAYLSAISPDTLGNVVYLMTNSKIRNFQFQATGLERFPPFLNQGIGQYVNSTADISKVLRHALMVEFRKDYYRRSKRIAISDSCALIYQYIMDYVKQ